MNSAHLDLSFIGFPIDGYPEDRASDAIEAKIALTLPAIAGLVPGLTDEQRLAVLSSTADKQRLAFIEMHGGPFGNELHCMGQVGALSSASQFPVAAA